MSLVNEIRKYLRLEEDGATAGEIANEFHLKKNTVYSSLRRMPDVYIDRWTEAGQQQPHEAIWCIVTPPENCPKPEPRKLK
jgi:orotate phosphoribosyltransferase-like protein